MENTAFFFETQKIPENSSIFDQFKEQTIFFSYFQVDRNYYLFFYHPKSIDINFLYQSVDVLQEFDKKQRKLRSFRGFLLYALEIIESGKDLEILKTNLQPFFWKKIKGIIRQNQKKVLLEFLFGSQKISSTTDVDIEQKLKALEDKIQILQNLYVDLQESIMDLEDQILKNEKNINLLLAADRRREITLSDPRMGLTHVNGENWTNSDQFFGEVEGNTTGPIFVTLEKISEEEKIQIIRTGFRLQAEGKISLKKYYESKEEYSLFEWKGYNLKYASISRTNLYQRLKEE